jgi:hypothetical protein
MAELHDATNQLIPSWHSRLVDIGFISSKEHANIKVICSKKISTQDDTPTMQDHQIIQREIEGPAIVGRVVSDPHSAASAVQRN